MLDNSILLKEITLNFVNKKPYLQKMIEIVEKNFDFAHHEKNLIFLLRNFEVTKEKYKNLLQFAKKYPIPVNISSLTENLKTFD